MKRVLIRVGVGVTAVVAAVLLFPRPDTGGELTTPEPAPIAFEAPVSASPAVAEEPEARVVAMRNAKKDAKERVESRRDDPTTQAVSGLTGPVGGIRYTLRGIGDEGALALARELEPAHKQLTALRRSPDAQALDDLLGDLDGAIESVRTSAYASNPSIQTSLERYDALRDAL